MSSQLTNAALAAQAYYQGFEFCTNILLTKSKKVRKNFRELFWSWPWRPWKFFKVVVIPDPDCYMMKYQGKTIFVGHPETIEPIRQSLQDFLNDKEDKG